MVRRLHDINQSGWWALLFLILSLVLSHEGFPLNIVCPIILVILAVVPGPKGVNRFGSDPVDLIRDSRCTWTKKKLTAILLDAYRLQKHSSEYFMV
jgi:hypothetical protein